MRNLTASEIKDRVSEQRAIIQKKQYSVNKVIVKAFCKSIIMVMTNYGPILQLIDLGVVTQVDLKGAK